MGIAEMLSRHLVFVALMLATASAYAQTSGTACAEIDKREVFKDSDVFADITAFDTDRNLLISAAEFRAYLLACDQPTRKSTTSEQREKAIFEAFRDLVDTRGAEVCDAGREACDFESGSLFVIQSFAADRAGDYFEKPKPQKPQVTRPMLALSRSISDSTSPLAKDKTKAPMLLAYTNDYETDEETALLLGKLSYGSWFFGAKQRWDANVYASFDVNTGKGPEESTVGFGASATYTRALEKGALAVSFTPEYGTDGNADRDVVALRVQGKPTGYLGFGQWKPIGVGWATWIPTFGAGCGEVRDAGGNSALAEIEAQGSYCRGQAGLEAFWRTDRLDRHAFGLRFAYKHAWDWQERWDRGYGEVEASVGLKNSPLQLILLYRKGRDEPTFEEKQSLTIGIGVLL